MIFKIFVNGVHPAVVEVLEGHCEPLVFLLLFLIRRLSALNGMLREMGTGVLSIPKQACGTAWLVKYTEG